MNNILKEREYIHAEKNEVHEDSVHDTDKTWCHMFNPFVHQLSLNSAYEYLKIIVMSIFVVPLRILAILILLPTGYIVAKIGTFGISREEFTTRPLVKWRRRVRLCLAFLGRMLMRCYGFHWVKIKGRMASRAEAPIIVVGPHSSFMDGIAVFWSYCPSLVSRIENLQLPFFGKFIDYTQPVYVHRDDSTSRQTSIIEIKERAWSKDDWPQIIIFPEGTCTNRSGLITFKAGGFYPGVPVQPLIIRYPNKTDCLTWTWDGPGTFRTVWTTLCQFHNHCELEYLPVYHPSPEEIADPFLYARNVRQVMADALGVPVADYTYDDCRIMHKARLKNLPSEVGLIEFQKLRKSIGNINLKEVYELLGQYAAMALSDGRISLKDFSTTLGVPVTEPAVVELFNTYDKNGCGRINFCDFLSYRYILTREATEEDAITLVFKSFGGEKVDTITLESFSQFLSNSFYMTSESSLRVFKEIDRETKGYLTLDDLRDYSRSKPEYAKLILLYQKSVRDGTRSLVPSSLLSNGLSKSKVE